MARPMSEKSKAIRKFLADEMMAGNEIDAQDIAETYGMSVRSIQYMIATIRKVLPADMLPKPMATEKQINCVVGIGSDVAKRITTSPDELRKDLESLTVAQIQGVISFARDLKKQKSILGSNYGFFVIYQKFLRHLDLQDFYRKSK